MVEERRHVRTARAVIAAGIGRGIADGVRHTARLFTSGPMAPRVDVTGRTFVVTGATPGSLGYEVARTLARWGGQVVATCLRDPVAMERSFNDDLAAVPGAGGVTGRRLDLAERASVEAFGPFIEEHFAGQLHVLVNNAGILRGMFAGREEPRYAPDGVEIHWRTNYLGAFHLTRLLLPLLTRAAGESGDARLVNVSSQQHLRAHNEELFESTGRRSTWDAYGLSKLAMVHMSAELHRRHGASDFRSVALHPGTVFTNMIADGFASDPRLRVLRPVLHPLARRVLLTPAAGAQTVLWCATSPDVQGGRYYERCAPARPSPAVLDADAGARLWQASVRWMEGNSNDE